MYRIAREAKSRVSIVRSVSGVTANATISARSPLHVSFRAKLYGIHAVLTRTAGSAPVHFWLSWSRLAPGKERRRAVDFFDG